MARPIGSSDIFAESAWLPSLKRYMDGDNRDRLTIQDRSRILFVHDALCSRDLPLVVLVSLPIRSFPISTQLT